MTPRDFVYWLQGFMEINEPKSINVEQTKMIKRHLDLVFNQEMDDLIKDWNFSFGPFASC